MKFKDNTYLVLRMLRDNFRLFAYILVLRGRKKKVIESKCHFLIVKEPIYAKLSMYSISSLLYFNPQFQIIIHCDRKCKKAVLWRCRLLLGSRCKIKLVDESVTDPMWNKALLILKLQGTNDFFVDADTRFNGKLPQFTQITTLVKEFNMNTRPLWVDICHELGVAAEKIEMLNTSLFSWSGHTLALNNKHFEKFYKNFLSLPWERISQNYSIEPKSILRLVEQVFLSIELSNRITIAVKNFDTVADKGLIESTYFGASGYRFGR